MSNAPEKLKALRLKKKKAQYEVAEAIGVTAAAYAMYEQGKRIPRDETKMKLARYFGKSVEYIFFK